MKNNYPVSQSENSHGVRAITFLFLLCLLSLNIQSCRQDRQLTPVVDNSKEDVTVSMANVATLLSQAFDDASKSNVLQNRQNRQALQASLLETVKRVKGDDYYNKIVDDAKTNPSKSWAIQDETVSQYADRKFRESTKSSNGKAMALSQTFKDYLEAMRNAVVNAGNQVVDGQSNTSAVDGQVVYNKLDQSLTTLDASIRNEIRLSDDEKKVLLASTAFTRTTSNPTTALVKSAFESSHGRGWGWFRAICNIVLTVAIIIAVTVAVAALAVAVLPVTMTVLGVTIAEGTIADAILGGGVGVLVTDAISGSYMCLFPDDGLNCN